MDCTGISGEVGRLSLEKEAAKRTCKESNSMGEREEVPAMEEARGWGRTRQVRWVFPKTQHRRQCTGSLQALRW
jgi:hypothetical protein